ncbi:hypothetical protein E2C01_033203 [Portunus trituberculatus]|uniref:Uncharacterized protein n=1 Tax=Portunus trituberculatus TaxID=210409 RepID=A0A5B7F3E3_PORTR|nr:hypothetical protein [Portunus trituberculatus]
MPRSRSSSSSSSFTAGRVGGRREGVPGQQVNGGGRASSPRLCLAPPPPSPGAAGVRTQVGDATPEGTTNTLSLPLVSLPRSPPHAQPPPPPSSINNTPPHKHANPVSR